MLDRRVTANYRNIPDPDRGIFLHRIPFFGDSRPEAIKRRKKWVDFVKTKRARKYSTVCSLQF